MSVPFVKTFCAWLLVALLAGLSGCSTTRLAYNQADHLVAWMVDDYFDLNSEQEQAFRVRFEHLHAWHRATQLPDYVALLDTVRQRLQAGAGASDADWFMDALKARYRVLVLQSYADAAHLLSTLSDKQLQATRRHFENVNRKYAKSQAVGASADEQQRKRARRQVERIEHWTGPLDATQEARFRELSRGLPLTAEANYQERLQRQAEFLALLHERGNTATFAPRLRDWLLEWDRTRSPQHQALYAQYARARAAMYAEVLASLSAEQRRHVDAVIQRYQQSFRELAAQAPAHQLASQP